MEGIVDDSPQPLQGASLFPVGYRTNSWISDCLASGAVWLLALGLLPAVLRALNSGSAVYSAASASSPHTVLQLSRVWEPESAVFLLVSLSSVKLSGLVFCRLSMVTHPPFGHFLVHKLWRLEFREICIVDNK